MFPTPIVMQDERLDFSQTVPRESRGTEVGVLFATTLAGGGAGQRIIS